MQVQLATPAGAATAGSHSATVECATYRGSLADPIRVRYSSLPEAFGPADFAAGAVDCHLVHIHPAADRTGLVIHFTGCRKMLSDLARAFDLQEVRAEHELVCPWAGEYRQAGLLIGTVAEMLDRETIEERLRGTGRPVELIEAARP